MSAPHSESFNAYARRCGFVFAAVVCGTLVMVGASQMSLHNHAVSIGIILAGACVNALLVAGYLMHLISERKMIYSLLAFTALFFVALMVLSVWVAHDLPGAVRH